MLTILGVPHKYRERNLLFGFTLPVTSAERQSPTFGGTRMRNLPPGGRSAIRPNNPLFLPAILYELACTPTALGWCHTPPRNWLISGNRMTECRFICVEVTNRRDRIHAASASRDPASQPANTVEGALPADHDTVSDRRSSFVCGISGLPVQIALQSGPDRGEVVSPPGKENNIPHVSISPLWSVGI